MNLRKYSKINKKDNHILEYLHKSISHVKPKNFMRNYNWRLTEGPLYAIGKYGKLYKLISNQHNSFENYRFKHYWLEINTTSTIMSYDEYHDKVYQYDGTIGKFLSETYGSEQIRFIFRIPTKAALAHFQYQLYIKKRNYSIRDNNELKKDTV